MQGKAQALQHLVITHRAGSLHAQRRILGQTFNELADSLMTLAVAVPLLTYLTPWLQRRGWLNSPLAKRREPVCTTYRAYWVCGMSPPSSGGIAVASALVLGGVAFASIPRGFFGR